MAANYDQSYVQGLLNEKDELQRALHDIEEEYSRV
jgi:hypothetical protein